MRHISSRPGSPMQSLLNMIRSPARFSHARQPGRALYALYMCSTFVVCFPIKSSNEIKPKFNQATPRNILDARLTHSCFSNPLRIVGCMPFSNTGRKNTSQRGLSKRERIRSHSLRLCVQLSRLSQRSLSLLRQPCSKFQHRTLCRTASSSTVRTHQA